MTAPKVNGRRLLAGKLTLGRVGAWHADVTLAGSEALESAVTLEDGGQSFVGTVVRSGSSGQRTKATIVGGAGGLSSPLEAKNYASAIAGAVTVRGVVQDILREAGETLSSTSSDTVLDVTLPKWQRSQGPASRALVHVVEHVGASWRVLDDGSIWVGDDTYPEQKVTHVLIDEDWSAGVLDVAPEVPALRPGVTFLGHQITMVVHLWDSGKLRTEAYVSGSPLNTFERIFGGLRREIDFSRSYPARVVSQAGDGTVSLDPDDPRMKGRGLSKVPIRLGLPGSVKVSKGARCLFAFANGDPSRPYVQSWESTSVDEVSINGGTLDAARMSDMVEVFPPGMTVSLGPVGTVGPASTGTPYPLFFVAPPPADPTPQPSLYAPIVSGNPKTLE